MAADGDSAADGDDLAVAIRLLRWRRLYGPEVPPPLDMLLADCDQATATGRVREYLEEHGPTTALAGAREFIQDVLNGPADPYLDQFRELGDGTRTLVSAGRFDEAVKACERTLRLLPEGHWLRAHVRLLIGDIHHSHAEATGNLEPVTRALSALDVGISGLLPTHPVYPLALTARAQLLIFQHEHSGGNHLDECVKGLRSALAATDEDDPHRAGRLAFLSVVLRQRECRASSPDPGGIAEALTFGRQAAAAAEDDATRGPILIELSETVALSFEAAEMTEPSGVDPAEGRRLLGEAIACAREGLALLTGDDPVYPVGQALLGSALVRLGVWGTDLASLREGERLLHLAQAGSAGTDPELASRVTLTCDTALRVRALATGELPEEGLLDRFPQVFVPRASKAGYKSAVAVASGDTTMQRAMIPELKAAVSAAEFSQWEPGDQARMLFLLAQALLSQARYQEADGAAAEAIRALEEADAAVGRALDVAPPGWISRLLALELQENIRDWMAFWTEAVPPGGLSAGELADEVAPLSDLEAIAWLADHTARLRGEAERSHNDLRDLLLAPEPEPTGTPLEPAAFRVLQSLRQASRLMLDGRAAAGHQALTAAIATLEGLARRRVAQADLDPLLSAAAMLATDAIDPACERGDHEAALTLHERVRGLLITRAIETRPDARLLGRLPPDDAARFTELSTQIDALDTGTVQGAERGISAAGDADAFAAAVARRRLTGDWEALLGRIRAIPGFERFLLPLDEGDMMALATDGPVVTVIPGRNRTHALIATTESIIQVPLPTAGPEMLEHRAVSLRALMETRLSFREAEAEAQLSFRRRQFRAELAWLWEAIACPVLDSLGLTGPPAPGAVLPRLWWSLPSHVGELPLHAAGYHDERTGTAAETVMSRVVSSYIPTLRSLAQSRTQPAGSRRPGRLIVSMSQTPGQRPLDAAAREAASIRGGDRDALVLADDEAIQERVALALGTSAWFHFAGHGKADGRHPGASSLLLHDGSLTARDVAAMRLRDAQLAFLSACETAVSQAADPRAQTLAGAFQLAGFRHVIGTLWRVGDRHALEIATDFYRRLLAVPGQPDPLPVPGSQHATPYALPVARILHEVIDARRRQWPDQPENWASHIHTGP